jgi:hypothetical protein
VQLVGLCDRAAGLARRGHSVAPTQPRL